MSLTRLAAMSIILLILPLEAVAANAFDPPLAVRHVKLSPDPQNPAANRRVSCFYYRSVVVKQIDSGEVGAQRLSLLPVIVRNAEPCREATEANEYVIPAGTWSGAFEGVKSDYAFFRAPDGEDGGLGFMVLWIADRAPVFQDIAQQGIRSITIEEGALKLRYQRVHRGSCSVVSGGPSCRDLLAQETEVNPESLSICTHGYRTAKEVMAKARCAAANARSQSCVSDELTHLDQQGWIDAPTVVVYEVEAILTGDAPVIARRSDALACRPSD